jgi:hypothetical protein
MPDLRPLRQRQRLAPLTAVVLAAAFFVACGNDDSGGGRKLSPVTASSLRGTLDEIEQDVSVQDCSAADQKTGALRGQVESLSGVNGSLRRALEASTTRLASLVASQCQTEQAPSSEPQGTTGASGQTGATSEGTTGEQNGKGKKKGQKKEKPPKNKGGQPPDEGGTPDQTGGGGGAGLPGESTPNGGN